MKPGHGFSAGTVLLLLLLITGFVPLQLIAHRGATGIVKERMDAMPEIGDANKIIAEMVKGKRELDASELGILAEISGAHAAGITDLFPESPDSMADTVSDAMPTIWERWEEFSGLAGDLEVAHGTG